jgi:hypothetical protein
MLQRAVLESPEPETSDDDWDEIDTDDEDLDEDEPDDEDV